MNTHITEEEAKQLPNKTMPESPYEGSGYLIVLNVFHDLHCIDSLRLALYYFLDDQWNSTYNPYTLFEHPDDALWAKGGRDLSIMHLDHCIDALRQSTQCNGDITPNVYQWSEKWGEVRAWATVVHECRNFDNVSVQRSHEKLSLLTIKQQDRRLGEVSLLTVALCVWRRPSSWQVRMGRSLDLSIGLS